MAFHLMQISGIENLNPGGTINMSRQETDRLSGRTSGLIALVVLLPFVLLAQSVTSEKAKVERAIHASIGWAKNKDFKLLYSVIANDSACLEVSPVNRITRGFAEFREGEKFWGSPDFKAVKYDIKDLTINLSKSGEVAWFYCVLDDVNEWKGEPASWINTRWTGVLEKRDGSWVIVQMHFSFAKEG